MLSADEVERVVPGHLAQLGCEQGPHVLHATAHGREFGDPGGAQARIAEDARGDGRPVIGRQRVDAARDLQHVALGDVGAGIAVGDHDLAGLDGKADLLDGLHGAVLAVEKAAHGRRETRFALRHHARH